MSKEQDDQYRGKQDQAFERDFEREVKRIKGGQE